uniref:ARAD1A02838p n=1 Tax=Blastobotrys adeninivorans TaxID=409370 RepID=A0A060SW87_BLAAD
MSFRALSNYVTIARRKESLVWSLQCLGPDVVISSMIPGKFGAILGKLACMRLRGGGHRTGLLSVSRFGRPNSQGRRLVPRRTFTVSRHCLKDSNEQTATSMDMSIDRDQPNNIPEHTQTTAQKNIGDQLVHHKQGLPEQFDDEGKPVDPADKLIMETRQWLDQQWTDEKYHQRIDVYKRLLNRYSTPQTRHLARVIFDEVQPRRRKVADYVALISSSARGGDLDQMEKDIATAFKALRIDKFHYVLDHVLSLLLHLKNEVPDRYYHGYRIYMETMYTVHGTVDFRYGKGRFKFQWRPLQVMLTRTSPTTLTEVLTRLIRSEPELGQQLVGTIYKLMADRRVKMYKREEAMEQIRPLFDLPHSDRESQLLDEMKSLYREKRYRDVISLYSSNPDLQSSQHYSVLLQCYIQLGDWEGLQSLFESMFGKGELPDLTHYRIVMTALAKIARVDVVDMLFDGILSRQLKPSTDILNAVMYSRLAIGDPKGVEDLFKRFESFGVDHNSKSYRILIYAYRDAKDLEKASRLFNTMVEINVPIHPTMIQAIISVCAVRRDVASADHFYEWARLYGVPMTLGIYHAYINCLVHANEINRALRVYQFMKMEDKIDPHITTVTILMSYFARDGNWHAKNLPAISSFIHDVRKYNMREDNFWYKVLLQFYFRRGEGAKAFSVFKSLQQQQSDAQENGETPSLVLDATVYDVVLEELGAAKRYDMVEEVYREMQDLNIVPTFRTHAAYLRAKIQSKEYNGIDVAENYVLGFLNDDSFLDLTSPYIPRDRVPSPMLRDLLIALISQRQNERARELLRAYSTSPRGGSIETVTLLVLSMRIYANLNQWDLVQATWDKLLRLLEKLYIRNPRYLRSKSRNADASGEYIIPPRHKNIIFRAINAKIEQLSATDQVEDVDPLAQYLVRHGIELTNVHANKIVQCLVNSDRTIIEGYVRAEKSLMTGHLKWIRYKMNRLHRMPWLPRPNWIPFDRYVIRRTLRVLVDRFPEAVRSLSESRHCSEYEALRILEKECPRVFKAVLLARRRFQLAMQLKQVEDPQGPPGKKLPKRQQRRTRKQK